MASVLLLSMIPFVIVLLVQVCNHRVMILIALTVSILTVGFYLLYQIASPWILDTGVAYLKEDQLQTMFLVKLGWLVDEDLYISGGEPNEKAIKSIFKLLDTDKNDFLGVDELKEFMKELTNDKISKEYATQEILRHFDKDKDGNISDTEFIDGCTRWLKKWNANHNLIGLSSVPSLCEKFLRDTFIGNDHGEIDQLDDKIDELFKEFDEGNKDEELNVDELEKLVTKKFRLTKQDHGKLFAQSLMNDLDKNKSGTICKSEVKVGLKLVLDSIIRKIEDKKIQELFDRFDVDEDGELNVDDLEKMTMDTLKLADQDQGKLFAQSIMKQFDTNKSGSISKSEVKTKLQVVRDSLIGNENGETEEDKKIEQLFDKFDEDEDGELNIDELNNMIVDTFKLEKEDQGKLFAECMMRHFDTYKSGKISKSELKTGLNKWKGMESYDLLRYFQCLAIRALGIVDTKETPKTKIVYLVLGAATIFLFTGPFVQSVIRLSEALHLPFYFASFFVAPLIVKSRSIVIFRFSSFLRGNYSNKSGSLTFFELYAELVMNNIMGLTMILAVVYLQGLTWDYTPEVVTIIVTGLLMGTFARTRETYPLWTCFPSFFLYVTITVIFCLYTSKWA